MAALKSFETACPKCGKTAFAISHPGPIRCPECGDTGLAVFVCERTKKGFPALWEQGGGSTNTGEAQLITGSRGEKLRPVYVRTKGHRANGQHALFIVQPGYYIVSVWYWNKQNPPFSVRAYRIEKIIEFDGKLLAIAAKSSEKPELREAINAAMDKARCYHCRSPHYTLL
jgi:DNA-directed RNA polymerase subunit RPC12/RpoP